VTATGTFDRDIGLQGAYAGIVTRFGGFVVDVVTITVLFALGGQVFEWLFSTLRGDQFNLSDERFDSVALLVAWAFFYCAYPLAVAGRTFGMAVVGTRAIRTDGSDLGGWHAVLRVLAFPLSFLVFGFGFLLILVNRDRRALHDLIAGTVVVYSWNARAARLRFLAKEPP
jgi:uncharacterized RDD family membrane protein YckC